VTTASRPNTGAITGPRRAMFNMAVKGASLAAEKGAQFLLVLAAAPILGAVAFGQFSFALSLSSMFAFATDLGLTIWMTRALARDPARGPALLGTGLRLRLWAAGPVVLALGAVALAIREPPLRMAVLALGIAALARAFLDHARAVFRAHERLGDEAMVNTTTAVLGTLGGVGFLFAAGQGREAGLPALAVGVMVGSLAGAGFGFSLLGRRYGSARSFWACPADYALGRRMLKEALPFWLAGIFSLVYARADVVLLRSLASDAEVGVYRAAGHLVEVTKQLPIVFLTALFPQLARSFAEARPRLARLERLVALALLAAGLVVGGLLALLAGPIVRFLFGPEFTGAVPALRLLAIAIPLLFVNSGLLHFFVARDRGTLNLLFAGAMVVVNLTANLLLDRRFGATGAAAAMVATEAVLSACCLYALRALRRDD
jgi:O-antigen/teichoic acid export membrane protein